MKTALVFATASLRRGTRLKHSMAPPHCLQILGALAVHLLSVFNGQAQSNFTPHVYPEPPEINPQRTPRAIELAKKHGIFLKQEGQSVVIGTRLQALTVKQTGKTWQLDSLAAGNKRIPINQASLLGGHPALDIPLQKISIAKDDPYEKTVVISGENTSGPVKLVFTVSWRGEFLTSDVELTTNANIDDADFWVGITVPTKQEAPIVHLLAPANAGHEWLACMMTPERRFEVDFTVFPGFSTHFQENDVRLTAVMDYGYTTFQQPPVERPLYHQPTRRETVFPRTLRRLSSDRIMAGYGWRKFPLPAGTYRTRIHWYMEDTDTVPPSLDGHEELVERTFDSLYDERLNKAKESDINKIAEMSLDRIGKSDCIFECAGYTGLAMGAAQPKALQDTYLWEHAYFSTLFWVFGEVFYNHMFERKKFISEKVIDDLGRNKIPPLVQFPDQLLQTLQQRGINESRKKTYDRELQWLREVTSWVDNPNYIWPKSHHILPRPETFWTRPQMYPRRDRMHIYMPASRALMRVKLEPELTDKVRAGCAALANEDLRMVGDTWLMESRGSCIRLMEWGMLVYESAYLHRSSPIHLGQSLRLASVEMTYRHAYDDLVHNYAFPGKLAAPYIDERGMVRGEDSYNSQYSHIENAWILRWDTMLRHTDEITPLLMTVRYVKNALPYAFPANMTKDLWLGEPGYSEYPVDGIIVEFLPELGRLGKFGNSQIYMASAILHAAIAFESYRMSDPNGFAHLTGSYSDSVLKDHDHVLLWNPMRLDNMKTDVTGRFVNLEGLELQPFQFRRLIIKREENALFAALPGDCERVTFTQRALRGLGDNAYVCTDRNGKDIRLIQSDRMEAKSPGYALIGSMNPQEAAALLPQLIKEYAPTTTVNPVGHSPIRAWDHPAGSVLSADPDGKERVSYRTFGISGFWTEPVGHHEQVKRTAQLRNVEARKDIDHTTWTPMPQKDGMNYRAVGFEGPEQQWEEGTKEEYFAAASPDNYIDYTIQAPWDISKLSIDIDAQIRGIEDKIKVFYSLDNGKTFLDGIEHANKEDYKMHGSFSYQGVLYGRAVHSLDLFSDKLGKTKSIIVRLALTPFDTTRFYNVNLTAFQ